MAQPATTEIQPARLEQYLANLIRIHIEESGAEIVPYNPELSPAELNLDELDVAEIAFKLEDRFGMNWGQGDEVYRRFSDPAEAGRVSAEPIGTIITKVSDYLTQQAQADPRLREGLERALAASP